MKLNSDAIKFSVGLMLRLNAGVVLFVVLIWLFNSRATHLMLLIFLIFNAIGLINCAALLWKTRSGAGGN
jgi:hypothetical protein